MQDTWTRADDKACFDLLKEEALSTIFPYIDAVYEQGKHFFKGQAGNFLQVNTAALDSRKRIILQEHLEFNAACKADPAAKLRPAQPLAPETVRNIFACTAGFHLCFPEVRLSVCAAD